jgi:hypothetical protein
VDQQLRPAVRGVGHRLDPGGFPQVSHQRAAATAEGDGVETVAVPAHEQQPAAVVREALRHRGPDSGRGAGDHGVAR